jgi:hypothetical protein
MALQMFSLGSIRVGYRAAAQLVSFRLRRVSFASMALVPEPLRLNKLETNSLPDALQRLQRQQRLTPLCLRSRATRYRTATPFHYDIITLVPLYVSSASSGGLWGGCSIQLAPSLLAVPLCLSFHFSPCLPPLPSLFYGVVLPLAVSVPLWSVCPLLPQLPRCSGCLSLARFSRFILYLVRLRCWLLCQVRCLVRFVPYLARVVVRVIPPICCRFRVRCRAHSRVTTRLFCCEVFINLIYK